MAKAVTKDPFCYWCQSKIPNGNWHHEVYNRACCKSCFGSEASNYRKIYGKEADAESEAVEVKRARSK